MSSKISNKGQLTSMFNRTNIDQVGNKNTQTTTTNLSKPMNRHVVEGIERYCNRPLKSRWFVSTHHVYKANDYDIVETSMKNCRLQRKYGTSNFKLINELVATKNYIKDNYDSLTIMELQNMITVNNESIIMGAIEKKIADQKKIIAIHEKEKREHQKAVIEKKARERAKVSMKLKGIYKVMPWETKNYAR